MKNIIAYLKLGWKMRLVFGLAGAGLGYLYYITIGCEGGCPITGNPWTSTAYGAFVGLLAYPGPSQKKQAAPVQGDGQQQTEAS